MAALFTGELILDFVFFWPLFMSVLWITGGLYFWFQLERHWSWEKETPAPTLAGEPLISILIPCFNEETWISRTIISCMNQNYPPDKLEVIVVDDCSTDRSVEVIKDTIEKIASAEGERMNIRNRLSYIVQEQNAGKRAALCRGVDVAKGEFVIFVDSDSFLDPYAVVNLVQPF